MSRIYTRANIARSVETVFDYVTTPGNWSQWHPATLSVEGAVDHPLAAGEQVIEGISVGVRRDRVIWTVLERERPRRWVIAGQGGRGGSATITYSLTPGGTGTLFERELVYQMPNVFLACLDFLLIRYLIKAQSARALNNLKRVLEPV